MPDLIIKPTNTSGNKVIIQDQGAVTRLQTDNAGITITAPTIASMANCTFPAGHVIQTQYAELLTNMSTSSTNDTSTGLACSITPTAATNYILATFYVEASNATSTYGARLNLNVTGGGTDGNVGAGTGGAGTGGSSRASAKKVITGGPLPNGSHGHHRFSSSVRFRCNDTVPNWSSGALTVTVMVSTNHGSHAARINWADGADNTSYSACSSQLILQELKG